MKIRNSSAGFLMSLEAAFSLTLLFIALAALPAFSAQKNPAPDFFLCSDAALSLAKSGAFSDQINLQLKAGKMEALSGMCIEAKAGLASYISSCGEATEDKISFSIPTANGVLLQKATVSCWRGK